MTGQDDKYYIYRPMLDLIGHSEGTDRGRGYNETLGYGAYTDGDVDLVHMTLTEVDALQTKMLKNPKNKLHSSAVGRYQEIRTTLREIRRVLNRPRTALFNADEQDRHACYLLGVRGIDKFLAGRLSESTMINNLSKEWASFPTTEGKSYYGGQRSAITVQQVKDTLAAVKARHVSSQPTVMTVPSSVDKVVKNKTNTLSSVFGVGGVGGAILAWLSSADWKVVGIVVVGGVVAGILTLLFGEWIAKRIHAIRTELETA